MERFIYQIFQTEALLMRLAQNTIDFPQKEAQKDLSTRQTASRRTTNDFHRIVKEIWPLLLSNALTIEIWLVVAAAAIK